MYNNRVEQLKTKNGIRMRRAATCAALAILLLAQTGLASCGLTDIPGFIGSIFREKPTAESTLTSRVEVCDALIDAIHRGDTELELDIACDKEDVKDYAENFDPFYGSATAYRIEATFDNHRLTPDEPDTEVNRVNFQLRQSDCWYVLQLLEDPDLSLPQDRSLRILAVANVLPEILDEIFLNETADEGADRAMSDYETALAVHNWLVANVKYDKKLDAESGQNSAWGALVKRKTLCQGYAEAFSLILHYATDVPVRMEIGDGDSGDGSWVGHAWNLVNLDGKWYQVDATFDDQVGSKKGEIDHYYFGQSDEVMSYDHRWEKDLWPAADSGDFLYYRKSGLYTKSRGGFTKKVRQKIDEGKPAEIEIAADGFSVENEDLQFIYREYDDVESIYWSVAEIADVSIIKLMLEYQEEESA
jgi:transglutaminase-like putative cysteine protease